MQWFPDITTSQRYRQVGLLHPSERYKSLPETSPRFRSEGQEYHLPTLEQQPFAHHVQERDCVNVEGRPFYKSLFSWRKDSWG
ncbi:hypothetical protein D3C77_540530 [compost metagenome]